MANGHLCQDNGWGTRDANTDMSQVFFLCLWVFFLSLFHIFFTNYLLDSVLTSSSDTIPAMIMYLASCGHQLVKDYNDELSTNRDESELPVGMVALAATGVSHSLFCVLSN